MDCREAFEKWASSLKDALGNDRYSLRRERDSYYFTFTYCAWEAFEAAWNIKSEPPKQNGE